MSDKLHNNKVVIILKLLILVSTFLWILFCFLNNLSLKERIEEIFFDIRSSILPNEYKSDKIAVISLPLEQYNSISYEADSLVAYQNIKIIKDVLNNVSYLQPKLMVLLLPPPYDERISTLVSSIKQYPNIIVGVYHVVFTPDFRYVPPVLKTLKSILYSADTETFYFKNISRSFPMLDANFDINNKSYTQVHLDDLKESDFVFKDDNNIKNLDEKFLEIKNSVNYPQKYKYIISGILNTVDPYLIFKIFPSLMNNYKENTINKNLIIKYPSNLPSKIVYTDNLFRKDNIDNLKKLIGNKIVLLGLDTNAKYSENFKYSSHTKVPMHKGSSLYTDISKLDLTTITLNNILSKDSYIRLIKNKYFYIISTLCFSIISLIIWKLGLVFSFLSFIGIWIFTIVGSSILIHKYNLFLLLSSSFICSLFFFILGGFIYIREESVILSRQKEQEEIKIKISKEYDFFLKKLIEYLKKIISNIRSLLIQISSIINKNDKEKNINNMLSKINLSIEDFDNYISDLMEFISISKKNKSLVFKEVSINNSINNILFRLDTAISTKHLTINNNTSSEDIIISDSLLVEQILFNLLSNAVKYAFENTTINIDVKRSKKYLIVFVSDEGIDISDEYKSRIFEKFYRIQNDTIYQIKGYGLGLYLSKYFCNLLNASIGLKESDDKFTTFYVKFNLKNFSKRIKGIDKC